MGISEFYSINIENDIFFALQNVIKTLFNY